MPKTVNRLTQKDFFRVATALANMADENNAIDGTRTSIASRVGAQLGIDVPVSTVKSAMEAADLTIKEEVSLATLDARLTALEARFDEWEQ